MATEKLSYLAERFGPEALPWILTALLAVAFLLALMGWRRAATHTGRANRRRNRIARRAENNAERLLEELGYTILDRQLTTTWWLEVDGEVEAVTCRVDLLVERDATILVADVKTGVRAPDPRHPATRRQLLEYLLAFEADGALVVDMERREVRTVAFPDDFTRPYGSDPPSSSANSSSGGGGGFR